MKWKIARRRDPEIAPDEIFLDSSNVPAFDRARFEGRLEKPLSHRMFFYLATVLALLFFVLTARAWSLQVTDGESFASLSDNNSLSVTTLFSSRGVITDFQGVILAENVEQPDDSPDDGQGVTRRNYPVPSLGQVIGYVSYPKKDAKGIYYDTTEKGVAGIEAAYDSLLAGKNGVILTEKDAFGKVRSGGTVVAAESGKALRLSIDARIQELFARAIAQTVQSKGFIAGSGIIMLVDTGAVRAMVSYPSYDPNVIANDSSPEIIAAYAADPGRPFLNHAVSGVYAPGSIVKPFVAAGALTDGIITPTTIINDPGFISLPDPYNPGKKFIFRSWKELGAMDVRGALAWSSSVFFYEISGGFGSQKGLGIDRLEYWYRQFGLGSPTGIDLHGEADGLIPTPAWKKATYDEPWYLGDTYFTAIGQYSMQVTPIQMVRAVAALASGGKLFTPSLVEGFTPTLSADTTPSYTTVSASAEALAVAREGMRQAVTSAIAGALNLPYVSVAAKTGTAETGTHNQYVNSWVEGFFPYENPRYAFVVVLERGPVGTGGQATQAMREFFSSLYAENSPYLGDAATALAQ